MTVLNLQPDDARVKPRLVTPEDELHRLRNQVQALRLEDGLRNLKAQKRLERVIRIAKEFRAAGERALDAALALTGENDRLRAELRAQKKGTERRDKQIASLLCATCQECEEMVENCIDNIEPCHRCEECFDLPEACRCDSRCPVCRGWKCESKDCAIVMREDAEYNRAGDVA